MKLLHKMILPLIAVAGLALATPAQAYRHHGHFFRGRVVVAYPGYAYNYSPGYYGYYTPGYYNGYYAPAYYAPYYGGGGVTFAFGGHRGYGYSYRGGGYRGGYSRGGGHHR
jgi:hypothetical protein